MPTEFSAINTPLLFNPTDKEHNYKGGKNVVEVVS